MAQSEPHSSSTHRILDTLRKTAVPDSKIGIGVWLLVAVTGLIAIALTRQREYLGAAGFGLLTTLLATTQILHQTT